MDVVRSHCLGASGVCIAPKRCIATKGSCVFSHLAVYKNRGLVSALKS